MDRISFIKDSLKESADLKLRLAEDYSEQINEIADVLISAFRNDSKLLLCGNGGSAADCQHIAAEFMIQLSHDLKRPAIGAVALTTDTSNLTAGGNDIGFENVFARSLEGLGRKGDVLLVISTSGNSGNLIKAAEKAKSIGILSIGFLGKEGGRLKGIVDRALIVPSDSTQRIQEAHITIAHMVCEIVERSLYEG